jgi:hypothetical protein
MADRNPEAPKRKDQSQFDGGKPGNRPQEQDQGRQQNEQFPNAQRRQQED